MGCSYYRAAIVTLFAGFLAGCTSPYSSESRSTKKTGYVSISDKAAGHEDPNPCHVPPLIMAIADHNTALAIELVEHGADVNVIDGAKSGPLYYAIGFRHRIDLIKTLLAHGAAINGKNIGGFAPLHEAADSGSLEIVDYLIAHGAQVNQVDDYGDTPLHVAATRDEPPRPDIVALLLAHGADASIRDHRGQTPLDWAKTTSSSEFYSNASHQVIAELEYRVSSSATAPADVANAK
jgi:ankyrin repeat protein